MGSLSYVDIPVYAQRLDGSSSPSHPGSPTSSTTSKSGPKITTSLPHSGSYPSAFTSLHPRTRVPEDSSSPLVKSSFNLPALLLSSALPNGPIQSDPRNTPGTSGGVKLLSTKDPLSIPITTAHFRRFVAKIGPVFWMQDRIEEVFLWKKGWKVTVVWMMAYAFLCFFPHLVLVIPNVLLISIILVTHPPTQDGPSNVKLTPPGEGSVDWQANLQAIQNLMGAYSDLYDAVLPLLPHLVHQTPTTSPFLLLSTIALIISIPLLSIIPLRPVFLVLGLAPFAFTHPIVLNRILPILIIKAQEVSSRKHLRQKMLRTRDDDRLEDKHWRSELREVELWENERWTPGPSSSTSSGSIGGLSISTSTSMGLGEDHSTLLGGIHADSGTALGGTWSKVSLRAGERLSWTRGRDGWSGVGEDGTGIVSNLTFSLEPGWAFVETEDWRPDLEATWVNCGSDSEGWVYSNDVWMESHAMPQDGWASSGMTRRRRWTRRIYCNPDIEASTAGVVM